MLTVSDTRTLANDTSGDALVARIAAAGHKVAARAIEKDEVADIVAAICANGSPTSTSTW